MYLDFWYFAQIKEINKSDEHCCMLQVEERRQSRNMKHLGLNECIAKDCACHAAVDANLLD